MKSKTKRIEIGREDCFLGVWVWWVTPHWLVSSPEILSRTAVPRGGWTGQPRVWASKLSWMDTIIPIVYKNTCLWKQRDYLRDERLTLLRVYVILRLTRSITLAVKHCSECQRRWHQTVNMRNIYHICLITTLILDHLTLYNIVVTIRTTCSNNKNLRILHREFFCGS
jgi:hypothetical protein